MDHQPLRKSLRIGPGRACSWFGIFLFMATSPLGCGGCAHIESSAFAQENPGHEHLGHEHTAQENTAQKDSVSQKTLTTSEPTTGSDRPELEEVARELICDHPHCSKESLSECTSCEYAVKYRAQIEEQIGQGHSKEQIVNWFADTYGEHIVGNPRPRGFGVMAAVVPVVAVLCGLLPLTLILRARRGNAHGATTSVSNTPEMSTKESTSEQATLAKPISMSAEDERVAAALREFDW